MEHLPPCARAKLIAEENAYLVNVHFVDMFFIQPR